MAGPHSAAALALIMQRFPYMTNEQALYTMFTTGRQNTTINDAAGAAVPNPTRGQIVQVPDRAQRLAHAEPARRVQGPGPAARAVRRRHAGLQRRVVERHLRRRHPGAPSRRTPTRTAAWEATKVAKGWTNGLPADASDIDKSDFAIGTRREQARNARVYEGSLTKRGKGTLFLTGSDTWHGDEHGPRAASSRSSARTRARSTSTAARSAAAAPWPATSTSPAACCSPVSRRTRPRASPTCPSPPATS